MPARFHHSSLLSSSLDVQQWFSHPKVFRLRSSEGHRWVLLWWDSPARSPKVSLQLPSFPKPRTRVVKELVCILGLQRETSTLTWAKVAARKCTLSFDPFSKNCARKEMFWGSSLEWWCSQVFTSPLCDYPCGKYSCRQIWHSLIKMKKALMSTLLREEQS